MTTPSVPAPKEDYPYRLRPLSLTVEEISEVPSLHESTEMAGQVYVKMTHEKARELFHILAVKLMMPDDVMISFSFKGLIK